VDVAIEIAVAKTHKYASRESGDTVEVVERPGGGLTLVMVDGQGSGRGARDISQMLVSRALGLIKDGVRDGVVARSLNDVLFAQRHGKVSAALDLVSVDLLAGEVVVTRQGSAGAVVRHGDWSEAIAGEAAPLGRYARTRPDIAQYPLEAGLTVVVVSDGISGSGRKAGHAPFELESFLIDIDPDAETQAVADAVLDAARTRDGGLPGDDSTVGVVRLVPLPDPDSVRRMSVRLPIV
jgi:serine phosphatase RsbU (regulator of sigma subunit)